MNYAERVTSPSRRPYGYGLGVSSCAGVRHSEWFVCHFMFDSRPRLGLGHSRSRTKAATQARKRSTIRYRTQKLLLLTADLILVRRLPPASVSTAPSLRGPFPAAQTSLASPRSDHPAGPRSPRWAHSQRRARRGHPEDRSAWKWRGENGAAVVGPTRCALPRFAVERSG